MIMSTLLDAGDQPSVRPHVHCSLELELIDIDAPYRNEVESFEISLARMCTCVNLEQY